LSVCTLHHHMQASPEMPIESAQVGWLSNSRPSYLLPLSQLSAAALFVQRKSAVANSRRRLRLRLEADDRCIRSRSGLPLRGCSRVGPAAGSVRVYGLLQAGRLRAGDLGPPITWSSPATSPESQPSESRRTALMRAFLHACLYARRDGHGHGEASIHRTIPISFSPFRFPFFSPDFFFLFRFRPLLALVVPSARCRSFPGP